MTKKTEPTDPHPEDEDVEQNIGDELKDPWSDSEQTDWPDHEDEVDD